MNIVFVINSRNAGGAEAHTLRLAARLAARHNVSVLALTASDASRTLDVAGVSVSTNTEIGIVPTVSWLSRQIAATRADLVVSVNLRPLALVLLSGPWKKHLSIFHSSPSHLVTQGVRAFFGSMAWLGIATLLFRRLTRLVFVSTTQHKAWRRMPPFCFWSTATVQNGVAVASIHSKPEWTSSRALRLAMVAAFRPEKNHRLLISALEQLRNDEIDFELELAGDGPLRKDVERAVRVANLQDRVRFLGSVKDCSTVYRWADITILPSVAETLPLVIAESMALGTPVIASDVGGNAELIDHGRNGVLFRSNDAGALASAIRDMRSAGRLASFGATAHEKARREFCVDQMTQRYEDLFQASCDELGA